MSRFVPTPILIEPSAGGGAVECVRRYLAKFPMKSADDGKEPTFLSADDPSALHTLCGEPELGFARSFAEAAGDKDSRIILFVNTCTIEQPPKKRKLAAAAAAAATVLERELCGAAVIRFFSGHPMPIEIEFFGVSVSRRGAGLGEKLFQIVRKAVVSCIAPSFGVSLPFRLGLQAFYKADTETGLPLLDTGAPKFWRKVGFKYSKMVPLADGGHAPMLIMWQVVKKE